MNRPSPYGRIFEIAFTRAMGAGAVDKVWRDRRIGDYLYIRRHGGGVGEETGPEPLSMRTFGVLFLMWFTGCFLSFILLLVEVWVCCSITIVSISLPPPNARVIYLTNGD